MGLAKCPNGHIYNPRRYGKICPYCNMKTQDEAFAEKPLGFEPPVEILEETVRPVCGWIICIEGAKVGMDYKIHEGKNFVGRGMKWISRFWGIMRSTAEITLSLYMILRT